MCPPPGRRSRTAVDEPEADELEPLDRHKTPRGTIYPGGGVYGAVALCRFMVFVLSYGMLCGMETRPGGFEGCSATSLPVSSASSYSSGRYGTQRFLVCLLAALTQALITWRLLVHVYRTAYPDSQTPRHWILRSFPVVIATWCILDVVQVLSSASPNHWVSAHMAYFAFCCATMSLMFFLWSDESAEVGMHMRRGWLRFASFLFLCVCLLGLLMAETFNMDSNPGQKFLNSYSNFVLVEWFAGLLMTLMHVAVGQALPLTVQVKLKLDRRPLTIYNRGQRPPRTSP